MSESVLPGDEGSSSEAPARPAPLDGLFSRLAALWARIGVAPAMVKSAGWSIGGMGAGAVVSFVVQIILARALQPTRYGVYAYLLAWVNVAVLLGKLEFDTAALRFVAAYDGQRRDGLLRGFWQYGWRVITRTATGVAVVGGGAAWLLRRHMHPGIEEGIWAACLLVPINALLVFTGSTLQGFRRVPEAQLPQLLLRPALFGLSVVLFTAGVGVQLSAGEAVALNAAATAVALGVSLFLLRRATPESARTARPEFETGKWMGTIRSFLVISAAQLVLSQQSDILVVGTLLSPRDAGLYSVASQLSYLTMLGAQAVVFVVLPFVSDLYARGRRAELQRLVVRTVQGCAALSAPVALLLFLGGPIVLRFYGRAFGDAYATLAVLTTGQFVGATLGIISGFLLTMTGHERAASRMVVGAAALNLTLSFVLTPLFGAVGAAVATVVAGLTRVGLLQWYARRYVGVAARPYFLREQTVADGA
ncbi:MAG TPA: oligosaccharide flippase family protein [Gemmatimonadales bacterium]|nr:oligosaccharide flippase family protein [Gemmatimonadales bacterium]